MSDLLETGKNAPHERYSCSAKLLDFYLVDSKTKEFLDVAVFRGAIRSHAVIAGHLAW